MIRMPHALTNRRGKDGAYELPEDGLYHFVLKGVVPNKHPITGTRILQVMDDSALEKMRANLEADGEEILVDREHLSDEPGGDTSSYGWGQPEGLEIRNEGLFGEIRLTALGDEALRGGVLRYVSPVFDWASVEDLGNGRYRPTRIVSLGLTNRPNCEGMMALSNRRFGVQEINDMSETNKNSDSPAKTPADEASVTALRSKVAELEGELATLRNTEQTLRNREADALLEHYGVPAESPARPGLRRLILTNREEGIETLKAWRPDTEQREDRVFNKSQARQPGVTFSGSADEASRNVNLLNRRTNELKGSGMTWDLAWNQAQNELAAGQLN